jgi:hypothetical protein
MNRGGDFSTTAPGEDSVTLDRPTGGSAADAAHPAAAELLLDAVGIAERRLEAGLEVQDVGLRGRAGGLKYTAERCGRPPNGRRTIDPCPGDSGGG